MSRSLLLPIRPDLHELFTHCERVLASAYAHDHLPLSQDEQQMLSYYCNQLTKLTDAQSVADERKTGTDLG